MRLGQSAWPLVGAPIVRKSGFNARLRKWVSVRPGFSLQGQRIAGLNGRGTHPALRGEADGLDRLRSLIQLPCRRGHSPT